MTTTAAGTVVVSIVIVVYRTPEFLRRALDSLSACPPSVPWEAIVIDNDPQTGDCAEVAAGRPGVIYVPNARNVGFGRACNQGMRLARGRYYLLLNPDMEVTKGSIDELVAHLEREPDTGIVCPRLHYADGRLQESCRTFYTLKIFLLRRTFLGKIFHDATAIRAHLMLDWDHEETRDVDWCIGAAMLTRREAVDDVGLMDERFFMYFEDVDWCFRMHQRGWRVVYHPPARMIHHYQRASARRWPTRGLWVHLGSTLLYYEKWSFLLYWLKLRARALRNLALFFGDAAMVSAAFVGAYALRAALAGLLTKPLFGFAEYVRFFGFTLVVALSSFLAFGLYRERLRATVIDNLLPVTRALAWTSVLMMASTFLLSVRIFSRFMVVLFFPLAVLAVTLGRVLLMRLVRSVRRRDLNLRRLAILGPADAVEELMTRFRRHGTFGLDPVPLSFAAAPRLGAAQWARRLGAERAQEVLLFEDWPGDVPGLLAELKQRGLPVRIIPALRDVLPLGSHASEFMGWPSLYLGGAPGRGRTPVARVGMAAVAAAIGLLWFVPYLLRAIGRRVAGRPVLEEIRARGADGVVMPLRRSVGARRGRGAWRAILDWYPSLPALASGRVGLVGIYPFDETEWEECDASYRQRPPDAPVGILGPWTTRDPGLAALQEWNRNYSEWCCPEEDLRIFGRALLGLGDSGGGKRET